VCRGGRKCTRTSGTWGCPIDVESGVFSVANKTAVTSPYIHGPFESFSSLMTDLAEGASRFSLPREIGNPNCLAFIARLTPTEGTRRFYLVSLSDGERARRCTFPEQNRAHFCISNPQSACAPWRATLFCSLNQDNSGLTRHLTAGPEKSSARCWVAQREEQLLFNKVFNIVLDGNGEPLHTRPMS